MRTRTIEQHGVTYYRVSRIVCAKVDGVDPIITRLEVPEILVDSPQEAEAWKFANAVGERYSKGVWIFTDEEAQKIAELRPLVDLEIDTMLEDGPIGNN